jgi:hypothetical protein
MAINSYEASAVFQEAPRCSDAGRGDAHNALPKLFRFLHFFENFAAHFPYLIGEMQF